MAFDVAGETTPRQCADTSAHVLDCDHEGEHPEHDPEGARTKTRAGNGVGRDAGWVVVCCARDNAGSERAPESLNAKTHGCSIPLKREPRYTYCT